MSAASLQQFSQWWHDRERYRAATTLQRAEYRRRRAHRSAAGPDAPPAGHWLSVAEAADILACSTSTVGRHAADGRLTSTRQGRRLWLDADTVAQLAREQDEWVSFKVASTVAGCSKDVLAAAVRAGAIIQRPGQERGVASLSRRSVEVFAQARSRQQAQAESAKAAARSRKEAQRQEQYGPPDDSEVWLDTHTTALVLGLGRTRVQQLARTGRLPHVRTPAGRLWFRRDHVEIAAAARTADRTSSLRPLTLDTP